jgi:DNA-directed RNA polymerase subunit K/omega
MSDAGGDFDDFSDAGGDDFFDDLEESIIDDEENSEAENSEDEDFRFIDNHGENNGLNVNTMKFTKMMSGSESRRLPDEKRTTRNTMDRYEFAKCLAVRTEQIANGAEPLIDVPPGVTDSDQIALIEIMQKKTPFILVRKLHRSDHGDVEEWWKLSELTIPQMDY